MAIFGARARERERKKRNLGEEIKLIFRDISFSNKRIPTPPLPLVEETH
jgi:hypothetical protein